MKHEDLPVLVAARMQQAAECIADGRFLLTAGRGPRTAVNRAYYAAVHAVLALLQTTGWTPRKYSGALSLFDAEFVRTGMLAEEWSADLEPAVRSAAGGRLPAPGAHPRGGSRRGPRHH